MKSMTIAQIQKELMELSAKHSSIMSLYLDHWLHYLRIELIEPRSIVQEVMHLVEAGHALFDKKVATKDGNQIQCFDLLGELFESSSGKGLKQMLGQFFTPTAVAEMTSKLVGIHKIDKEKGFTANDPTCGSGRQLIMAHWEYIEGKDPSTYPATKATYFGNDIDTRCTKMTLINMMLNGMSGEVTNGDGLWLHLKYYFGYQIKHIPIAIWVERQYPQIFWEYLSNGEKPPSMQQAFDYYLQSDIWQCEIEGKWTISSRPGDNHFRCTRQVSKEQSLQVPKMTVEDKEAPTDSEPLQQGQLQLF